MLAKFRFTIYGYIFWNFWLLFKKNLKSGPITVALSTPNCLILALIAFCILFAKPSFVILFVNGTDSPFSLTNSSESFLFLSNPFTRFLSNGFFILFVLI